jgi:histidinol-phosphate aminotransferase
VATAAQARLATLPIYSPGRPASAPAGKLSSNEAPLGPPVRVREAIAAGAGEVNRYPSAASLITKLAANQGVGEEKLVVTNGSDELCYLIATLLIEPGSPVVLSDPCYQIDELVSRLHRGEPRLVPTATDGGHDLPALAQAADGASVLWLPTPHNPTGCAVDPAELAAFLDAVPSSCLVVLDEAYRSYVDPARRPDVAGLIARHPNLLVQRTFSKSYALAGLRLGYGLADAGLIAALNQIKPPFNVNAAAIAAAEAALESPDWRDYAVELVCRERERLERTLERLGVEYFPSQANFVTFRVADPGRLDEELERAGLVARDGADLGLPGWLRISIGSPPVMARLRAILEKVL